MSYHKEGAKPARQIIMQPVNTWFTGNGHDAEARGPIGSSAAAMCTWQNCRTAVFALNANWWCSPVSLAKPQQRYKISVSQVMSSGSVLDLAHRESKLVDVSISQLKSRCPHSVKWPPCIEIVWLYIYIVLYVHRYIRIHTLYIVCITTHNNYRWSFFTVYRNLVMSVAVSVTLVTTLLLYQSQY